MPEFLRAEEIDRSPSGASPGYESRMDPLPIDGLLPEVVAALRRGPGLVLEAPPGAGKTTRVPRALLEAGLAGTGEIVVLEPRRLAARVGGRPPAPGAGGRPPP